MANTHKRKWAIRRVVYAPWRLSVSDTVGFSICYPFWFISGVFYCTSTLSQSCHQYILVGLAGEEWDAKLQGFKEFDICTDHKNMEYFMTTRKLIERQIRWSLLLSRYNFRIIYVPGKENEPERIGQTVSGPKHTPLKTRDAHHRASIPYLLCTN